MAVGTSITAADFNNIRSILENNFGPGDYGFTTGTGANDIPNAVVGGNDPDTSDTVLSADVERLFSIGQLIHYHQTGAVKTLASATTYPDLQVGEVIEWADWGDAVDVQGLYDLANSCANFDRHTTEFGGDFSTATQAPSTQTSNWQRLEVTFTNTWGSVDEMYEFFRTGGELRISGSVTNLGTVGSASYDKNLNWQTMISNMGTVRLFLRPNAAGTAEEWVTESLSASGTGTVVTLNPGVYYTAYTKFGAGSIYNDNAIRIRVRISLAGSVDMFVQLADDDTGTGDPADGPQSTPIDEPVTADIDITQTVAYADSTITLNDGTTDTDFTLIAPEPTNSVTGWTVT